MGSTRPPRGIRDASARDPRRIREKFPKDPPSSRKSTRSARSQQRFAKSGECPHDGQQLRKSRAVASQISLETRRGFAGELRRSLAWSPAWGLARAPQQLRRSRAVASQISLGTGRGFAGLRRGLAWGPCMGLRKGSVAASQEPRCGFAHLAGNPRDSRRLSRPLESRRLLEETVHGLRREFAETRRSFKGPSQEAMQRA